jgi:hypothetical protein
MPLTAPHSQSFETCIAALETLPDGLTAAEAARRLSAHGPNRMPDVQARGLEASGLSPVEKTDGRFKHAKAQLAWECESLGQRRLMDLVTGVLDDLLPDTEGVEPSEK